MTDPASAAPPLRAASGPGEPGNRRGVVMADGALITVPATVVPVGMESRTPTGLVAGAVEG